MPILPPRLRDELHVGTDESSGGVHPMSLPDPNSGQGGPPQGRIHPRVPIHQRAGTFQGIVP